MMMGQSMPQPAFYIFKCEVPQNPNFPKPACVNGGNRDLFQHLNQRLMEKGIIGTVQPVQSGCMGRCGLGPVMMVEPNHTMYVGLTKEKIDRIIDEHIIGGKVVDEYVVPKEAWADAISVDEIIKMNQR